MFNAKYMNGMKDVLDTTATLVLGLLAYTFDPQQQFTLPPDLIVFIKIAYTIVAVGGALSVVYWVPKIRKTILDDYGDNLWKYLRSPFKRPKRKKK